MKIHFVGIGGVSMSALAKIMQSRGHTISGSDLQPFSLCGGEIFAGHCADNIRGCDLVVYTSAVKGDNPELRQARNLGIPTIERAKLLGQISSEFGVSVAVSGAHGKTTTTGMLACCLEPLDPTVHMGGYYNLIGGNVRLGGSEVFVTEACEYKRAFLSLEPSVAVVLNIDADHLDYFRDISDIADAFGSFARRIRPNGTLVICGDDKYCQDIAAQAVSRVVRFGFCADNDYSADGITEDGATCSFNLLVRGQRLHRLTLRVPGAHNILNALAAIAASVSAGMELRDAASRVCTFEGVNRRFQLLNKNINGAPVYLDYAHHPAELKKTLCTARNMCAKKLIAVFQPHTFSRTKALKDDFRDALLAADHIILADTYAARETPLEGVTSQILSDALSAAGKPSQNIHTFEGISAHLKSIASTGDIVMILGAGNIDTLADLLD